MNEVDTYFLIDECGAFMWRMNHDMAKGRIPEASHAAIQEDSNDIFYKKSIIKINKTEYGDGIW